MNPLESYQRHLAVDGFKADAQQQQAILALQRAFEQLQAEQTQANNLWQRVTQLWQTPHSVRGVYLWGSVGVGKTWLMDIFYEALPSWQKLRMHFHRFMQYVHSELKLLQGHANPLREVARRLASQTKIICLDEFLVNDIVDAMLLANFLQEIFALGITLVTTANVPPEELYRNGLQRARFLPAIDLLLKNLEIVHLTTQIDYRLRAQAAAQTYFYPISAQSEQQLQESFWRFAQQPGTADGAISIAGRPIKTICQAYRVVWFEFNAICAPPRSQIDYLELARLFTYILISNVPIISPEQKNTVRYLINLVDVCYDARVKLILSAAGPVEKLYVEGELVEEFRRTRSRLLEMQGVEYLAMQHMPP